MSTRSKKTKNDKISSEKRRACSDRYFSKFLVPGVVSTAVPRWCEPTHLIPILCSLMVQQLLRKRLKSGCRLWVSKLFEIFGDAERASMESALEIAEKATSAFREFCQTF
jgi:hypothetical protein